MREMYTDTDTTLNMYMYIRMCACVCVCVCLLNQQSLVTTQFLGSGLGASLAGQKEVTCGPDVAHGLSVARLLDCPSTTMTQTKSNLHFSKSNNLFVYFVYIIKCVLNVGKTCFSLYIYL